MSLRSERFIKFLECKKKCREVALNQSDYLECIKLCEEDYLRGM